MRRRASFVTAGALSCLAMGAASALADGLPGRGSIKDTAYAPAASWSGVYLGVFAGGTWARDRWSSDETSPAAGAPIDLNSNDFTGGGLIGANLQMGRWVWGAELDVGFLNGGRTLNFDNMADVQSIKSEINWNGHARLRFGYDGGRFMPFIAGGLAFAETDATFVAGSETERHNQLRTGASLGAGVDFLLRDNWLGRVEYIYDRYNSASFGALGPTGGDSEHFDLQTSTVRGALILKLN
jgi:outer membrane immunogenic protein